MVQYLLDHGALIDAYAYQNDERCETLVRIEGLQNGLHRATRAGNGDIVELLLKRGADRIVRTGRVIADQGKWDLNALEIAEME